MPCDEAKSALRGRGASVAPNYAQLSTAYSSIGTYASDEDAGY